MYKEINSLLAQSQKGDRKAKEKLALKLKPLILSSIKRYYNKATLYDDLIQEGYEVVLRCIRDYNKSKNAYFLGYVKTMLMYHYLDKHKKKYNQVSINKPIGDEIEIIDTIADDYSLEDSVVMDHDIKTLWDNISNLTDRQKTVILLYYIKGISLKEICKRLNVSYRTVVNTKVYAIEKIKANLL